MLKKALAKLNVISLSEHEKLVEKAGQEGIQAGKKIGLKRDMRKGKQRDFKME